MKTIGAAKFKEQCLTLLDQLDADGLVVTKGGKPVACVIPYGHQCADLIGSLRHKVKIRGDIFTTCAVRKLSHGPCKYRDAGCRPYLNPESDQPRDLLHQ